MFSKNTISRNALVFIMGEGLWGFNAGLVAASTVLAVLLKEFGAGNRMIGSIGALESGLTIIPQIFGMYFFHSIKHRKRNLIVWHLVAVIPFLFVSGLIICFENHYSAAAARWGLLLSFACFMCGIGIILGVWMDWIAHIFEAKTRGTLMGMTFFAASLMGALGALMAGAIINRVGSHFAYAILYFIAGFFASVSLLTFFLVKDPAENAAESSGKSISVNDILSSFKKSLLNENFKSFLLCRILASLGFCIIPFIAIYFKSDDGGGLSNSAIVSCGAAMTFGAAISNLALGRIGDMFGHRIGIIVGTLMQVVTLLIILVSSGLIFCIITYFCIGICISSSFMSHTNMLLETCPHDHRLAHITVGNLVLSVPLVLSPFVAGIASENFGIRPVFMTCLVFSFLSFIWCLLKVKEPRYVRISDLNV
jgi:MFS family permease